MLNEARHHAPDHSPLFGIPCFDGFRGFCIQFNILHSTFSIQHSRLPADVTPQFWISFRRPWRHSPAPHLHSPTWRRQVGRMYVTSPRSQTEGARMEMQLTEPGRPIIGSKVKLVVGTFFTLVGVLLALDNLDIMDAGRVLRYWPVLLIVIGALKFRDAGNRGLAVLLI